MELHVHVFHIQKSTYIKNCVFYGLGPGHQIIFPIDILAVG